MVRSLSEDLCVQVSAIVVRGDPHTTLDHVVKIDFYFLSAIIGGAKKGYRGRCSCGRIILSLYSEEYFIGRELDDRRKYYDKHVNVQRPLLLVSNRFLGKTVRLWQGLKSCAVAHTIGIMCSNTYTTCVQ